MGDPQAWDGRSADAPYVLVSPFAQVEGIGPAEWAPRELRHSFESLLSDVGVPIEEISRLVDHSGTSATELVYRH